MIELKSDTYTSPIGEILVVAHGDELCLMDFQENDGRIERLLCRRFTEYKLVPEPGVLGMQERLDRYFNGDWNAFEGVPVSTAGTDFQREVWRSLKRIHPGVPISYSQLAESIDRPKAVRAVANANANNPISIAIPCHRVIGVDGSLRGYAGATEEVAMHRKSWLLRHEGWAA